MNNLRINSYYYKEWQDEIKINIEEAIHCDRNHDKVFMLIGNKLYEYEAGTLSEQHIAELPLDEPFLMKPKASQLADGYFIWWYTKNNFYFWKIFDRHLVKYPFTKPVLGLGMNVDEKLVAIYYEDNTTQILSVSLEHGLNMPSVDEGEQQQQEKDEDYIYSTCDVGWGSTNTQFTGRKAAPTVKIYDYDHVCNDNDVIVKWDSSPHYKNIFAVAMMADNEKSSNRRIIKLYNKECTLMRTLNSQFISGILPSFYLSASTLVASFIDNNKRQELRMFDFSGETFEQITFDHDEKLLDFYLSDDGVYLAVVVANVKLDGGRVDKVVRLYSASNYKWTIQHEMAIASRENSLINIQFRSVGCACMLELYLKKNYVSYVFAPVIYRSQLCLEENENDYLVTVSVEGKHIIGYAFGECLSTGESCERKFVYEAKGYIKDIIFHHQRHLMAVVYATDDVDILNYASFHEWTLLKQFTLATYKSLAPITYYRFYFYEDDEFHALALSFSNDYEYLCIVSINDGEYRNEMKHSYITPDDTNDDDASKLNESNRIDNGKDIYIPYKNVTFATTTTTTPNKICLKLFQGSHIAPLYQRFIIDYIPIFYNDQYYHFYLDSNHNFYLQNQLLLTSVTSIIKCQQLFIAFITKNMTNKLGGYGKLGSFQFNPESNNISCEDMSMCFTRDIENDSKLLHIKSSVSRAVVQMKRGNMEVVIMNGMQLRKIADHLSSDHFDLAYNEANLTRSFVLDNLFDINPSMFRKEAGRLLLLTRKPIICKFIAEAKNECSLTQQEIDFLRIKRIPNRRETIGEIFYDLTKTFNQRATRDFLDVCVLTLLVADKGNAKCALNIISEYFDSDNNKDRKIVDNAIKQLQKVIPFEEQYSLAVQMLNFKIARHLVELHNQDLLMYRMQLDQLENERDASIQQFLVHFQTGNYSISTELSLQLFNQGKIKQSTLFELAIRTNTLPLLARYTNRSQGSRFSRMLANKLSEYNYQLEAGNLMERNGHYIDALNYYKKCFNWEAAKGILKDQQVLIDRETKLEQLNYYVNGLRFRHKYAEAFNMYVEVDGMRKECVELMMDAHMYMKAYTFCVQNHFAYELEHQVIHVAVNHLEADYTEIMRIQCEFDSMWNRLKEYWKVRKENVIKGLLEPGIEDLDDESIASSISGGSGSTQSRSKRKEERKLRDTRPGSKYEDIALIASLHELITSLFNKNIEIQDLCQILFNFYGEKYSEYKCIAIHKLLHELQSTMIKAADIIWQPRPPLEEMPRVDRLVLYHFEFIDPQYLKRPSNMEKIQTIVVDLN